MNLIDGMFPSALYGNTTLLMNTLLPAASMTPPTGRIASFALTILFGNIGSFISAYTLLPLASVTAIPVHKISEKSQYLADKVYWLSAAINIGTITAVAYALFNSVVNPYGKVVVFAIHQAAIGVLGRAQSVSWFGAITLDNGFSKLLGINEDFIKSCNVDHVGLERIGTISERIACTAFIVSTVALAYIGVHPILNSAMSSATASAVKALSIRVQLVI